MGGFVKGGMGKSNELQRVRLRRQPFPDPPSYGRKQIKLAETIENKPLDTAALSQISVSLLKTYVYLPRTARSQDSDQTFVRR